MGREVSNFSFKHINELDIIVLEKPFLTIHNPFVRDLIGKIIQLKIEGYDAESSNYFAFDTSDLIASHFICGKYINENFQPLISFKGVSLKECKRHQLEFNGESVVSKLQSSRHKKCISKFIEKSLNETGDVGYTGSLAMSPHVTRKENRVELLKIFEAMIALYNYHNTRRYSMCIARISQGAPNIISRVGYKKIKDNFGELPPQAYPQYIDDYFELMTMEEVSKEGLQIINNIKSLWERRFTINGDKEKKSQIDKIHLPGIQKRAA